MIVMRRLHFFILLMLTSLSLSACADKPAWQGTYSYEAMLGENVADDAVIIEYALSISHNECSLQIEGYQVSESILCTTREDNGHLNVDFKSYADGSVKNIYDVAVYTVGGTLFSFSHENNQLLTIWGELIPDESLPQKGVYFLKK